MAMFAGKVADEGGEESVKPKPGCLVSYLPRYAQPCNRDVFF